MRFPRLPPDALAVYELAPEVKTYNPQFRSKLTPLREYIAEGHVPEGYYTCPRCCETGLYCFVCRGSKEISVHNGLLLMVARDS